MQKSTNSCDSWLGQEQLLNVPCSDNCPVTTTISLIGGKWKILILWQLRNSLRRFGQLQRLIPGITKKMLTQQLRELEKDGLVSRKVYAEVPPRVEYSLTNTGRSLIPVLETISNWGSEYLILNDTKHS